MRRNNWAAGYLPVVIFFVAVNGFFIYGKHQLDRWGVDQDVVIAGNLFLMLITLFSFFLARRGMNNPNPHAFVRSVYISVMLKLFLSVITAFIYISIYKSKLNKPALFFCMGLYLVYTFIEVAALTKLLKQKKNA